MSKGPLLNYFVTGYYLTPRDELWSQTVITRRRQKLTTAEEKIYVNRYNAKIKNTSFTNAS